MPGKTFTRAKSLESGAYSWGVVLLNLLTS